MARRITARAPFAFCYLDLDNLKAYNDYYGFEKGDVAIKLTSEILLSVVGCLGGEGDFIGHVGGDDFVVITAPERAEAIANDVKEEFDARFRQAVVMLHAKQYEHAATALHRVLAIAPALPEAIYVPLDDTPAITPAASTQSVSTAWFGTTRS